MRKRIQMLPYVIIAVGLLAAFAYNPAARAMPSHRSAAQTVPTRTPTALFVPTERPPARQTGVPGSATPQPATTATPLPTGATVEAATSPAAGSRLLRITIEPSRTTAWPGGESRFTITVSNAGPGALQQVLLEMPLPPGVQPAGVPSGRAAWSGNSLRLRLETLPAGGRAVVAFTVRVAPGFNRPVIVLRPVVTAGDGVEAAATAVIAMPPVELPPTGGQATASEE